MSPRHWFPSEALVWLWLLHGFPGLLNPQIKFPVATPGSDCSFRWRSSSYRRLTSWQGWPDCYCGANFSRTCSGRLPSLFLAEVDVQRRCANRLHHGIETPESVGERITAAAHHAAGIVLSDCASDGVWSVGAGAAADGHFILANGAGSGVEGRGKQRQQQS